MVVRQEEVVRQEATVLVKSIGREAASEAPASGHGWAVWRGVGAATGSCRSWRATLDAAPTPRMEAKVSVL
jgi:hypothetical protein